MALASPTAQVRAVAARVINLGGLPGDQNAFLADLQNALEREADPEAAREEMRALCVLGGTAFDPVIIATARRFAPRLDADLLLMLARARGPDALDLYFQSLQDLTVSPKDRQAFLRLAAQGDGSLLVGASARVLGRRDAAAWQALLNVATERRASLAQPVLVEALRSNESVFRGETAWYLARTYCDRPPEDATAVFTALSEGAAGPAEPDPELRFGTEMLRRVLGRPPVEDEGWISCLESNPECHLDAQLLENPLVDFLTAREREAVYRRNDVPLEAKREKKRTSDAGPGGSVGLRQISGLPGGVAAGLLKETGCRSTQGIRRYGLAEIQFRPDGLPKQVVLREVSSEACVSAARSLFLLTMATRFDYVPSDRIFRYVVFFDPESLACNAAGEEAPPGSVVLRRVRGKVIGPVLVKKVEPIYPLKSREQGEKGVNVYEAIITHTGCVTDVALARGSHPRLDIAGMDAVSRWRYRPATLDGRPVRSI
ncbi:MAG: energy transducer TonB [Thermoanaerobaculia bacterium]